MMPNMKGSLCAALAGALLLAAQPAAAQASSDSVTDPSAQSPAWHAEQQLYLLGLTPANGWHFIEGGVRWRWVNYLSSPRQADTYWPTRLSISREIRTDAPRGQGS